MVSQPIATSLVPKLCLGTQVLDAQLRTETTDDAKRSFAEGRIAAKLNLVRSLYDRGYTVDEVRMWFRLIDWMMHLSKDLDQRFRVELEELEEELQMQYATSIERLAKEEGREQGREQGREAGREEGLREFAVSMLAKRFNELPSDVLSRLSAMPIDQMADLQSAIFSFHELADLRKWMDQLN